MKGIILFKTAFLVVFAFSVSGFTENQIADSQKKWIKKYKKQKLLPDIQEMLINTDPEPNLKTGFVDLYNGKDLKNWRTLDGQMIFEPAGEAIRGIYSRGSSTYLCTTESNYSDFIFTVEVKWEVDCNTGVLFRSAFGKVEGKDKAMVYGPQAEMEEKTKKRYWSGGIYGQGIGGWIYPLWLEKHKKARRAIKRSRWNRLTIKAKGPVVQIWLNGVPTAQWETDEYLSGFFGLQVHAGKKGQVLFRKIKIKEL